MPSFNLPTPVDLPAGTNLHEYWAADEWYQNLTYAQKDFLQRYYHPIGGMFQDIVTASQILRAYRERDITHSHSDWPIHPMRSI